MEQSPADKVAHLEAQLAQMGALLQQNVQQTQQLLQQMQQHQAAAQAQPAAQMQDSEDDDDPAMPEGNWDMVLRSVKVKPTAAPAISLLQMLAEPPSLQKLKESEKDAVQFQGVPETPGPRRHRVDFNLWQTQQKLEQAMNFLVSHLQSGDRKELGLTAALVRSAWQDLHEQRRALLAGGKGKSLLEKRPDDEKPRLLNPQEEEKINKARKPLAKAKNIWGRHDGPQPPRPPQPPGEFRGRPRSRSQTRGKGKGKGGGGPKQL